MNNSLMDLIKKANDTGYVYYDLQERTFWLLQQNYGVLAYDKLLFLDTASTLKEASFEQLKQLDEKLNELSRRIDAVP